MQNETNEEMAKQKIRLDRETAEKNEAFDRIRELDGKVSSAATLVSIGRFRESFGRIEDHTLSA